MDGGHFSFLDADVDRGPIGLALIRLVCLVLHLIMIRLHLQNCVALGSL